MLLHEYLDEGNLLTKTPTAQHSFWVPKLSGAPKDWALSRSRATARAGKLVLQSTLSGTATRGHSNGTDDVKNGVKSFRFRFDYQVKTNSPKTHPTQVSHG
ncbi:hypothetical protein T265_04326 [Opisthorchis viverrini]|uniref:Uncharacterized protein n=1 Tax=Opisthorchis viverrini TaxID=6198 RepID=A0A075A055_OPIVI|nr:hypothetical protein T265_04326 [Opisthorchis viverrini]KER28945.1 hypothetical protein T265_04326 [Opisthorchis viverrini]